MGGQPSASYDPCPSVVPFVTPPEHATKLWLDKSSANKLRCANGAEVILLGDSRTEGWLHGCAFEGMICTKLSQSAAVAGSGGDRVQHILWRVLLTILWRVLLAEHGSSWKRVFWSACAG